MHTDLRRNGLEGEFHPRAGSLLGLRVTESGPAALLLLPYNGGSLRPSDESLTRHRQHYGFPAFQRARSAIVDFWRLLS